MYCVGVMFMWVQMGQDLCLWNMKISKRHHPAFDRVEDPEEPDKGREIEISVVQHHVVI